MDTARPRVFVFNWPSYVGGADTKLVHLLRLLRRDVWFTLLPNDEGRLRDREWVQVLEKLVSMRQFS